MTQLHEHGSLRSLRHCVQLPGGLHKEQPAQVPWRHAHPCINSRRAGAAMVSNALQGTSVYEP